MGKLFQPRLDVGDADILRARLEHQLIDLADLGQPLFFALHASDGALALQLVAQQFERGRHGRHHERLDGVARVAALIGLAAGVEQQHRDTRIGRRPRDDGMSAQVRLGAVRADAGEGLAQVDPADGPVQARDIGKQVVDLAIHHGLPGGTAAAVVLIGEALGFQQLYIIDGDRHGTLQPEKKTPPRRGVGSRVGGGRRYGEQSQCHQVVGVRTGIDLAEQRFGFQRRPFGAVEDHREFAAVWQH